MRSRVLLSLGIALSALESSVSQEATSATDVDKAVSGRRKTFLAQQAQSLIGGALGFADPLERINTLSELGLILCQHDKDGATSAFLQAHKLLTIHRSAGRDRSSVDQIEDLRTTLVSRASRCEGSLGRRFAEEDKAARPAQDGNAAADFRTALEIVRERPSDAGDLALSAVQNGLIDPSHQSMIAALLGRIRRDDPAKADQLFMGLVSTLGGNPTTSLDAAVALGQYLFSAANLVTMPEAGMETTVAGVRLVNLSTERPGISNAAASGYLLMVAAKIGGAFSDDRTRSLAYAAGLQFLPHVMKFLPELAPQFEGQLNLLAGDLPPQLAKALLAARFQDLGNLERDGIEEEIAAIPDRDRRDRRYVEIIRFVLWKGNWPKARRTAALIKTEDLRTDLERIISAYEAGQRIERKDYDEAERIADSLPPTLERCLLKLSIAWARGAALTPASRQIQDGVGSRVQQDVLECLTDLPKIERERRAAILLSAAGAMALTGTVGAQGILIQAIDGINSLGSAFDRPTPLRRASPANSRAGQGPSLETIRVPFQKLVGGTYFPLNLPSIGAYDFGPVLRSFVIMDFKSATAAVSSITNEHMRGRAFASLLQALVGNVDHVLEQGEPAPDKPSGKP